MLIEQLTVDQWIAVVSSAGTLLAAFLAFFSIREIRKQRTQEHLPRLTPTTGTINAQLKDFLGWEASDPEIAKTLPTTTNDDFLLPLINVGNGAATDIRLEWKVEVDHWVQKINNLSAQTGTGIGVSSDGEWLTYLENGENKGAARLPDYTPQNLEYVLPVASNKDGAKIHIPPAIKLLLQAYYRCYFRNKGDREVYRNPGAEFRIDLQISYKDTIGKQFSRRSIINVSALMGISDEDGNPQYVTYGFSPARTEPAEGDSIVTKTLLRMLTSLSGGLTPFGVGVFEMEAIARRKTDKK